MKKIFTLLFLSAGYLTGMAQTPFLPTSVVVYRVGDGTAPLRGVSTRVFLDEYSPTGTLIQSVPMPTTASGTNNPLTASGTSTSEGMLTRSVDGRYLIFGGYGADSGIASIASSASTTVKRVVGRVDALGAINTSTLLNTSFGGGAIRSVASVDGNNLWIVGNNSGVRYTTIGDTATRRINGGTLSNIRTVNIFNNQLYISTGSGSTRVATVGTGTPTDTGNVVTNLPGVPTGGTSPYQFFMANTDGVGGPDVLYVADDASQTSGGGVKKYAFNSGTNTWDSTGIIFLSPGTRGLTGSVVGSVVNLYATTPSKLYTINDAGGTGAYVATVDSIATAPTNTAFRGVALAPQAAVAPLKLISFKGLLSLEGSNLSWTSANEVNMKNFTIERSKDGRTFNSIGSVVAKNRNQASYSFLDKQPFEGANYYRLKLMNADGSFTFSNTVIVGNRKGIKTEVFPNPAVNSITVSHSKAVNGATVVITNAAGQQVTSFKVQSGAIQTSIAVDKLSRGHYTVIFQNGEDKSASKFMKQ